jgi:hypothetical protein
MLTVTDYCTIKYSKKSLIIMVMIESIQTIIMLTLLIHVKKLPVGRVKNGEEDVSDGENVEDEGECQHRDEDG